MAAKQPAVGINHVTVVPTEKVWERDEDAVDDADEEGDEKTARDE